MFHFSSICAWVLSVVCRFCGGVARVWHALCGGCRVVSTVAKIHVGFPSMWVGCEGSRAELAVFYAGLKRFCEYC